MEIDLTGLLGLQRINLEEAIVFAILDKKDAVLALNNEQLDRGVDAEEKDLGSYKIFKYKGRFKPIDLKLHGDFRAAEDIIFDQTQMSFVDRDFKAPYLTKRFGQNIIGLSEKNIAVAAEIVQPGVIEYIEIQLA
jgi:hypothetical protein